VQPTNNRFYKFFGYGLLLVNIFITLWLFACYAASVISPAGVRYIALFSLTTPFAILANTLFIIIWLFTRRKWRLLFPLLSLAFCSKLIPAVFGLNYFKGNDITHQANTVKLMHWNIHGMGYYDKRGNDYASQIMNIIKDESPDILCLPEYYINKRDSLRPFGYKIMSDNNFKEYRFCMDNPYNDVNFGIAVFSKYPINAHKYYRIGKDIYMMQCDVVLPAAKGTQIVRMFFTHLRSFMFSLKDKEYIADVKNKKGMGIWGNERTYMFLDKLNNDYAERASEAANASAIIKQSPYPVLLCGDMNDLPGSYTYTTMRNGLDDAFSNKGKGLGRTYNELSPTLRIDDIFYDPHALRIIGYNVLHYHFSDHYPLIANFAVK